MATSDKSLPAFLRPVRREAPDVPEQDIDSEGETAVAWGFISAKPVFGVSFEWPDGVRRGFRYMHLESDMALRGDTLVLRFSSAKVYQVTIKGLRLGKLYYLLQRDRVCAVRQSPRGFDDQQDKEDHEAEPLIQSIVVEEVEED